MIEQIEEWLTEVHERVAGSEFDGLRVRVEHEQKMIAWAREWENRDPYAREGVADQVVRQIAGMWSTQPGFDEAWRLPEMQDDLT